MVINSENVDSKIKLLEMKEKILELDFNNRYVNLKDYKELAIDIDKYFYDLLVQHVKAINSNQSLNNELEELNDVILEYNQLLERQYKYKKIYSQYSDEILNLSDLSVIKIDNLNSRYSIIEGYLRSFVSISQDEKRLEELNRKQIIEEKKKDDCLSLFSNYDEILREQFIKSQGRKKINAAGPDNYISVISEYQDLGYDFNKLINNSELLVNELNDAKVRVNESNVKYRVTVECCQRNASNEDIIRDIIRENYRDKYRFCMLRIIYILSMMTTDYEDGINKRKDLLDLIKTRESCLKGLGIYYDIDPFNVKCNIILEQIAKLDKIGSNKKLLKDIIKEISDTNSHLIEATEKRRILSEEINNKFIYIDDKRDFSSVDISNVKDESLAFLSNKYASYDDNQVAKVDDYGNLDLRICREKANNVINRVYNMIHHEDALRLDSVQETNVSEYNPDFVVEEKDLGLDDVKADRDINNDIDSNIITNFDDIASKVVDNKDLDGVTLDSDSHEDVVINDTYDDMFISDDIFPQLSLDTSKSDEEDKDSDINSLVDTNDDNVFPDLNDDITDVNVSSGDDVFPSLDNNNVSNNNLVEENNNNQETEFEMPDEFWTVQDEPMVKKLVA